MIPTLLKLGAAAAGVYLIVLVLAWKLQHRMVFPGPRSALPTPAARGIPDGERVSIVTADGVTLRGWYLPPRPKPADGERAPGLIWFYGNMETVEGIAPVLRSFRPPGVGVAALDYRGYGESDGTATEAGVYRDAEAVWEFLVTRPEIDPARIAVYGRSVGSAPALHLATNRPARAVILDSPFTTGRAMARRHYRFLPPVLMRMTLNNLDRAAQLTQPLLVFHGADDWIAPIEMGREIADAGRAEELIELRGAGHNETYLVGGEQYRARFRAFLDDHLDPSASSP